jgi:predicted nicotinamide N-methyase
MNDSDSKDSDSSATEFVRAHTTLRATPFLPEIRLHLAADAFALWEETERQRGGEPAAPPFWAFPWAGGQALARYVLDHPGPVAGRRVLDLASGSGLVAVAAALAGAARVTANEIDGYALAAIALNASANRVRVEVRAGDLLDGDAGDAEVVLAGDVFYSRDFGARVLGFLDRARARGALVLVGDPGRAYLPRHRLTELASHQVPVVRALEDAHVKRVTVGRLADPVPAAR